MFGQSGNKVKEVNIVQIKIKDSNGLYIFIEAISCPKICWPQKYYFAKNNHDHLKNVNLLKHSGVDSTFINELIGNYFFYSFINGNIIKDQKDKPSATETYLGVFVLSGVFIEDSSKKEGSMHGFRDSGPVCKMHGCYVAQKSRATVHSYPSDTRRLQCVYVNNLL